MEQPANGRSFKIDIPEDMVGGVWANFASVSHSPYEFTIDFIRMDFARRHGEDVPGRVVARVNLSPMFITQLMEALQQNWSKYAEGQLPPEVRGE